MSFSQGAQTVNQSPIFVYVKTATAKVSIKPAGQSDWNAIQKFGRLFSGDSLKMPEKATVLLGDGSSPWKELTGPKVISIAARKIRSSRIGRFFERLYRTFFIESQRRPFSREATRNLGSLLLAVPDTVLAYSMPDSLRWIKNGVWWMQYQVHITRNRQTVWDTVVEGNSLKLSRKAGRWQQPGHYKIRVIMPQGGSSLPEVDSTVIRLQDDRLNTPVLLQYRQLKNRVENTDRREDYFALLDFCLHEKLYLEAEHYLVQMVAKFPDNPEPQIMLYAYYSSFLPEDIAERLVIDRRKELR